MGRIEVKGEQEIIAVSPQAGRDPEQDELAARLKAEKGVCTDCTAPIWISPRTKIMIEVGAQSICIQCAVAKRTMAQIGHAEPMTDVIVLGGKKEKQ